jgi:hypothetical protein
VEALKEFGINTIKEIPKDLLDDTTDFGEAEDENITEEVLIND